MATRLVLPFYNADKNDDNANDNAKDNDNDSNDSNDNDNDNDFFSDGDKTCPTHCKRLISSPFPMSPCL